MARIESVTFKGASGRQYQFECYDLDTSFKSISAVYILAERTGLSSGKPDYVFVYIGQTDDLRGRLFGHNKSDCFKKNNANCICINIQLLKRTRHSIEKDLLDKYSPPCND